MSAGGKGAISDRHYLAQSMLGGHLLWPEVDVALAVGTRFTQPLTSWGVDDDLKVIRIDIDPDEPGKIKTPDVGIVADAKQGLVALTESFARHAGPRPSRQEELLAIRERAYDLLFELQPQMSFTEVLRNELPDDGIFVDELTQVGYFSRLGFPVYQPRTFVTSGYQGTLGYGFATALGAQVGNPGKKVVSINGDGGFYYNVQELSTMAKFNINMIAIVFNDGAYGNVKRIQQQQFDGRTIASDLYNPEVAKTAEAFGVQGIKAEGPEGLRSALEEAMKNDAPTLIEVPVGEMPGMWHLVRRGQRT